MKGAVGAVAREQRAGLPKEGSELYFVHLARGHRKLAMMDRAETGSMAVDGNVVRRIGENHHRAIALHELGVCCRIERAAAVDPMLAEQPEVSRAAHRGTLAIGNSIRRVFFVVGAVETLDTEIDLAHFEPGGLEREVKLEHRQLLQLFGE